MECNRCLMTDDTPGITIGPKQCSACDQHDALCAQYPTDKRLWDKLVIEMKAAGRGRKYDCVVGISGGCDSSYMLLKCVQAGLRCLAVNWDNHWGTDIAEFNMMRMTEKLKVPFIQVFVKQDEYDDIVKAFLEAGVPDIEAPADIGFAAALYGMAEVFGVKYICEGHSFRTEGVSSLSMLYFDGRYIQDVYWQMRHKPLPPSYGNMKVWDMVKWMAIKGIRKVRPLYYIGDSKHEMKALLMRNYGWRDYGAAHTENKLTAWWHDHFMRTCYHINTRVLGWSALVRSGQMSKEEAEKANSSGCPDTKAIREELRTRGVTCYTPTKIKKCGNVEWLGSSTSGNRRTHRDFKTYRKLFRRTKLFWWILVKLGLMPVSFMKYCRKGA